MSGKGTVTSSTGSQEGTVRIVQQGGASGWPAIGTIAVLKNQKFSSLQLGGLYSIDMVNERPGAPLHFVITPSTTQLLSAQISITIENGESTIAIDSQGDYPDPTGQGAWESWAMEVEKMKIGEVPPYKIKNLSTSKTGVSCAIIPVTNVNGQQVGNWVDFVDLG